MTVPLESLVPELSFAIWKPRESGVSCAHPGKALTVQLHWALVRYGAVF